MKVKANRLQRFTGDAECWHGGISRHFGCESLAAQNMGHHPSWVASVSLCWVISSISTTTVESSTKRMQSWFQSTIDNNKVEELLQEHFTPPCWIWGNYRSCRGYPSQGILHIVLQVQGILLFSSTLTEMLTLTPCYLLCISGSIPSFRSCCNLYQ